MWRGWCLSLVLLAGCGEAWMEPVVQPGGQSFGGARSFHRGAKLGPQSFRILGDEGFSTQALRVGGADLRSMQSPIRNQGEMGACTGFAISALRESMLPRPRRVPLSPLFIYQRERQIEKTLNPEAGIDEGAELKTGMQVLKNEGVPPDSFHPYPQGDEIFNRDLLQQLLFSVLPDRQAHSAARDFRVHAIRKVDTLSEMRYWLSRGHGVVFIFQTFKGVEDVGEDGVVAVPPGMDVGPARFVPTPAEDEGAHAVLAVGFSDKRQQIIFKNSWGPEWGDKGYGYLPYLYFKKGLVWDGWMAE